MLGPVATRVALASPDEWRELRYQTQYGPETHSWPYYPAALEFSDAARDAVHRLPRESKTALEGEWHSKHRYVPLTTLDAILDRYSGVVVDLIIQRARVAGRRTSNF